MPAKSRTRLIRVGDLLAEVDVDLLYEVEAWAPHLSLQDMRKIERVRKALESGDLNSVAGDARLFDLSRREAG